VPKAKKITDPSRLRRDYFYFEFFTIVPNFRPALETEHPTSVTDNQAPETDSSAQRPTIEP